jgi:WD40 repeat protein
MSFFKISISDVRLLGVIAAALITVSILSNLEPVKKLARSEVARGEPGFLVISFALSPTTGQIATTDDAGRVKLRSPEKGWQIERSLDFPGYAMAVAFSPDGRCLAIVGIAPGICLWDLSSGTSQLVAAEVASIERAAHVIFSPDGQTLAVTTDLDGTIFLWDLPTSRVRLVLHHPSSVASIAFSPDGRWLATGGNSERAIHLWDVHSGSRRVLVEGEPGGHTRALAFSPDGALLASAGFPEHYVRLWDLKTRRVCRVLEGHARIVTSVAFSPDGSLIATAGNDGMLGLWTVPTGQRRVSLDGQGMWFRAVAFTPDGRTLVSVTGNDDDIRWWDVAELLRAQPEPNSSLMKNGSIELSHRYRLSGRCKTWLS